MTNPDLLLAAVGRAPMAMAVAFMMLSLLASAQTNPANRPDAAVRSIISGVLGELQRWLDTLRGDAALTRQLIERATLPHLDLNHMTRYVLGSYWQNATPAQYARCRCALRAHLLQICSQSMEKYAVTLDQLAHSARVYTWLLRHDTDRRTATVRVLLMAPRLGWIHFELQLYNQDASWKVYEITSSGINLLVGIRSDIQAQLRRDGLEAVIRRLERRTGLLPASHSPPARDSQRR
ncbi:MAG: ABC transporter substrate-binding protein [Nitrococcus sp.]|nr:ABC transporter substrate-binding protein [Nitrococcus sp.]